MGKKLLLTFGFFIVLAAAAGGAFYGGMLFQQSQVAGAQARFFADRGGAPPADFAGPGGAFAGGQGGNLAGGGQAAVGEIKSIDGNVVTLSTPQSEVQVTLTDATQIQ
jgi:hypothetical protein